MIISIRGTSGSGKTHLARRIFEHMGPRKEVREEGHRLPVAQLMEQPSGRQLAVLGCYAAQQGGADTLRNGDRDYVFGDLMRRMAEAGDVLYEGLMVANEVGRTVQLAREHPTHVIFLSTPISDCLDAINARRAARGKTEPVSEKKTREKYAELMRVASRLRDAGVPCQTLDREAAYLRCCELLGLTPQ